MLNKCFPGHFLGALSIHYDIELTKLDNTGNF